MSVLQLLLDPNGLCITFLKSNWRARRENHIINKDACY